MFGWVGWFYIFSFNQQKIYILKLFDILGIRFEQMNVNKSSALIYGLLSVATNFRFSNKRRTTVITGLILR